MAALLLFIAAAFLLVENRRMRTQMAHTEAERAKQAQVEQELNRQLQQQQGSTGPIAESPERTSSGASVNNAERRPPTAAIASFVLAPAMRGAGGISTVAVPRETTKVRIKLKLDVNDFSRYRVTLEDPAAGRELWHSAELTAESQGENKAVSIILPVNKLQQQNYIFELNGIRAGAPEFITSYPFRFVIK